MKPKTKRKGGCASRMGAQQAGAARSEVLPDERGDRGQRVVQPREDHPDLRGRNAWFTARVNYSVSFFLGENFFLFFFFFFLQYQTAIKSRRNNSLQYMYNVHILVHVSTYVSSKSVGSLRSLVLIIQSTCKMKKRKRMPFERRKEKEC